VLQVALTSESSRRSVREIPHTGAIVFAVLLLVAIVLQAAPANANPVVPHSISTCGTRSNYFDGYYFNTTTHTDTFEGASSYIVNRYGAVCNTDKSAPSPGGQTIGTNFTTAWSMIAAYDGNAWAQAGFIRGYNSPQYEWAEFTNAGLTNVYNRFPASPSLPDGVKHAYRELWTASCACIIMSIDGVELTQTNYDPYGNWNGGPNGDQFSPQFFGEVTYTQNDIPGVPTSKTAFSALGAQQFSNDSLGSMPCELNSENQNSARWAISASSCTAFNIWTSHTS
jgi:hypothetical protein